MQLTKSQLFVLLIILGILVAGAYITFTISEHSDRKDSAAASTLGTDELEDYTTLSGEPAVLNDFEGTVRVVNSWASWSPFSRNELGYLDQIAAEYADQGVNVIAINRNEDRFKAQHFISQVGPFEHVVFLLDGDDTFYDRMDGKAMPETLFFDTKGNVVFHARGDLTYEEIKEHVEAALNAH